MSIDDDRPFTLVFVGHATQENTALAAAYEDEVLPLLTQHGARLLYRGRRTHDQSAALPLEVHLIWFPHRRALASYLADPRRVALVQRYGDVFSLKEAVEMETIVGDAVNWPSA